MGKKKVVKVTEPSPVLSLDAVNDKFKKLKELNAKLAAVHDLYGQRDTLLKELLPLFIVQDKDAFLISREITIGSTTHRFTPGFYDVDKSVVKSKSWKSVAFDTGSIETI
jgi:hypothetical protein